MSDAEKQKGMQRSADERVHARCRTFNEIMSGPNPLTPAEIGKLVARHPERWGMFSRWGTT